MNRTVKLVNLTDEDLHLKERPSNSSSYGHRMTIASGETKLHPASFYRSRNAHGQRTSVIVLFVGKYPYRGTLTPRTFLCYSELIFQLVDGELKVTGVPAGSWDLSLIRGLGFLRGLYGRREAVPVLTTTPVQAAGSVSLRQIVVV